MKQGLSLRVSQHLALTPQLQQSIRLLQLSTLELQQEIEQLLLDNPLLEMEGDEELPPGLLQADAPAAADEPAGFEDEETRGIEADAPADWEGDGGVELAPDDSEWGGDAPGHGAAADEDTADAVELARGGESLADFLRRQALALRLNAPERGALELLIGSLNEDGYLEDSLEHLAHSLVGDDASRSEELLHHLTVALRLLQSLEPPGVGARDLAECLELQLRALADAPNPPSAELLARARCLCRQPLELLARRDLKRLAQACGGVEAPVREALALITRLEPKPGRRFVEVERNIIVPDVLVTRIGGAQPRFRVQLNPDVLPRLRVQETYARALKGRGGEPHAALQQRLQEARWFIKSIQQRFDTILRVSRAIVERQRNFFLHGELAMRPLVLREIADELGLHESTISRVTTAKYMATPLGTYELKYFFGSGLDTESGTAASSTAVRALLRQLVMAENPKKPLSDSQLSALLKEQGIECARRTVAKYREALRIAPANLRKSL